MVSKSARKQKKAPPRPRPELKKKLTMMSRYSDKAAGT